MKKCRQWETINLAGSRTRHLFPSLFHPPSSSPLPAPPGHPFALTIWETTTIFQKPASSLLSPRPRNDSLTYDHDEHVIDSNCTNRTIYFFSFSNRPVTFSSYRPKRAKRSPQVSYGGCVRRHQRRAGQLSNHAVHTFYTLLPKNFFPFSNFDFDREDRLRGTTRHQGRAQMSVGEGARPICSVYR